MLHFQQHSGIAVIHTTIAALASESNFVITAAGRIGKGGLSIQVGHLVVLFSGIELPMYVRRSGEGYILVGTGYVHDIMYGEAWPEGDAALTGFMLV